MPQRPIARKTMIDDGRRIIAPDDHTVLLLIGLTQLPRLVHRLDRHTRQFRQPLLHEHAFRIEALALQRGIEHAEEGLRIRAHARRPLPATHVRGAVAVDQLLHEILLTLAPVDQQILGQERRHDHARAIVHPACSVQHPHRRIDHRITGASFAPRAESVFVFQPLEIGELLTQRLIRSCAGSDTAAPCRTRARSIR